MIMQCPYCNKIIPMKYPVQDNQVDERDMEKVEKHMLKYHKDKIKSSERRGK